jgi:hypothetical protein
MLRGHNDDFGADAVEFQIDPGGGTLRRCVNEEQAV